MNIEFEVDILRIIDTFEYIAWQYVYIYVNGKRYNGSCGIKRKYKDMEKI